jgi:hypothetical protein
VSLSTCGSQIGCDTKPVISSSKMGSLKQSNSEPCTMRGAVIVLVAVCSLTVSLATRYYSPRDDSSPIVKAFQSNVAPDAKRQRLTKNAANWMPPIFSFTVFQIPSSYYRIVPPRPPVRSLICDKSLYNRPPPAFQSLS